MSSTYNQVKCIPSIQTSSSVLFCISGCLVWGWEGAWATSVSGWTHSLRFLSKWMWWWWWLWWWGDALPSHLAKSKVCNILSLMVFTCKLNIPKIYIRDTPLAQSEWPMQYKHGLGTVNLYPVHWSSAPICRGHKHKHD